MPPKFCGPKFRNEKVIGSSIFGTLVPIFSKLLNFGPHILALLESPPEGRQGTQSMWAKVQKQISYGGLNSDDNSDFLEIGELWSTYFDVVGKPYGKATSHQNFVGQSSETKKLLNDQILSFGPNSPETGELWSTYVGIFEKPQEGTTKPQNIMDQSSKTRKLLKVSDFELWSRFFPNW